MYIGLHSRDLDEFDISQHFLPAYEFITQARKQNRIIGVNCVAGVCLNSQTTDILSLFDGELIYDIIQISRSATIVASYLMRYYYDLMEESESKNNNNN